MAPEGTPDAARRLESGVIGRAWGGLTRRARALGWMAFGAYVVTPTALALRLDGLPLNTKPELLALLAAGLLGWARLAGWLMRSTGTPARASSSARVPAVVAWPLVAATAVFLFLIPVKLAYPPSDGLALCLRSPEIPEPGCVWSPEGPAPGPGRDVTRYEPLGYFDRVRGRAWRLGYLNTRTFTGFDEPQDTPGGRRQRLRTLDANPFDASLRLSPRLAALLASRFGDETGTVTFAGSVRGTLALDGGLGAGGSRGSGRASRAAVLPGPRAPGAPGKPRLALPELRLPRAGMPPDHGLPDGPRARRRPRVAGRSASRVSGASSWATGISASRCAIRGPAPCAGWKVWAWPSSAGPSEPSRRRRRSAVSCGRWSGPARSRW